MATISASMVPETVHIREHNGNDSAPMTVQIPTELTSPKVLNRKIPNRESQETQNQSTDSLAVKAPEDSMAKVNANSAMDTEMDLAIEEQESDDNAEEAGDDADTKKKKGQRFFCTGYPPCNLSFTRSEHLARHIRKHTGERPFQCHCSRRFSRLDNLRQHAQTVHVNEEIPAESLAASGTRYQRQIRSERRPAPRPRTSSGGHSRGHSRNLSTSSIGSTVSNFSTVSSDVRRRPPSLLMPTDGLVRPHTPPSYSAYAAASPQDPSSNPILYPGTPGSPSLSSTLGSPVSAAPRMVNGWVEQRTPARRLSVPSSQHPDPQMYGAPYSVTCGAPNGPGPAASVTSSPVVSTSPQGMGPPVMPGDDWRRRTWHPTTYSNMMAYYGRPGSSGLSYSQTSDGVYHIHNTPAPPTPPPQPRLPGIESFDHVRGRPDSPPKRGPSPAQPGLLTAPDVREGNNQYPELENSGRPGSAWGPESQPVTNANKRHSGVRYPMDPPPAVHNAQLQQMAREANELQSASKRVKRVTIAHPDAQVHRTSPESTSSDGVRTPRLSSAEVNPVIVQSSSYIEPQLLAQDTPTTPCLAEPFTIPHPESYTHVRTNSELDRLQALVAVATSQHAR